MDVGQLGEFQLIDRIRRLAERDQGRAVVLGIGDDAALLRPGPRRELAISADAAIEGVHFDLRQETAKVAGSRAAAAAFSDLAAMGAEPLGFTLSLSVPPRAEVRHVIGLVRGLLAVGSSCAAPLVGGNVARSKSLELHLSVIGQVERGRALRRSGARAGDRLFVSGPLGRSALERRRGRVRHVPESRIHLGRALARSKAVVACIDVSDGLLADLGHLCAASRVGCQLEVPKIPRPRGFDAACRRARLDPEDLILAGGEDYELLFAVRGRGPAWKEAEGLSKPVEIGRFTASGRELIGSRRRWQGSSGWRHF